MTGQEQVPPSEAIYYEAWGHLILTVEGLKREFEEEVRKSCHIPATWFEVVVRLSQQPGGTLRMKELASRLIRSPSRASRIVTSLEKEGLVTRQSVDGDLRGFSVSLTDNGWNVVRTGMLDVQRVMRQKFEAQLTEDDARTIIRVLSGIPQNSLSQLAREKKWLHGQHPD